MLSEQILSDPILLRCGALRADLGGPLAKATKFVLQRDFAMAADGFSVDLENCDRALNLAWLPYPECSFEVVDQDRKPFAALSVEDGSALRLPEMHA